jgi:hypothetical protein
MPPQESIERRMAALFVLAMGLILWQAPRTHPLKPPRFVSVIKRGEQAFPIAVPSEAPLQPPADPGDRRAFLKKHVVEGFAAVPPDACEGFVRMSAHHWLRVPILRQRLPPGLDRSGAYRLVASGDPFTAGELRAAGPGPEVEVFCEP